MFLSSAFSAPKENCYARRGAENAERKGGAGLLSLRVSAAPRESHFYHAEARRRGDRNRLLKAGAVDFLDLERIEIDAGHAAQVDGPRG